MRIRKRLPPPPPSDPQLNNHSVVAVQPHEATPLSPPPSAAAKGGCNPPNPTPPDNPTPIRIRNPAGWGFSGCDSIQRNMEQKEVKEEEERITSVSNDSNKESISIAHQDSSISQPFSSFDQEGGRWYGGDREVPLKKRRVGFEKYVVKEIMKPRMKSKTNKKCVQEHNINGDDDAVKNTDNIRDDAKKSNNNKKRGSGEIMEGSRCSRVNGRGWRCCQQTLVGYSLCEHHLGKGRLRSLNNNNNNAVRNRRRMSESTSSSSLMIKKNNDESDDDEKTLWLVLEDNVVQEDDDDIDDDERKKLLLSDMASSSKKRKKIGMVKARSMSSLLGQTNNMVSTKPTQNEDEK